MAQVNFDSINKIWYGEQVPIKYKSDCNAGAIIIEKLKKYPNKIAQYKNWLYLHINANSGLEITNKEMVSLSIRVAQNLQLKGYQQNDVIGIMASNSDYLAPVVFGAFLCGTPISTVDPSFHKRDIKHVFGITKPKIIFCDAECYKTVTESITELNLNSPIFILKGNVSGVNNIEEFFQNVGDKEDFNPPNWKGSDEHIAAILCSSGTTGLPKGVCLSHCVLINNTDSKLNTEDICLHFSTLYWLSGLLMLMFSSLSHATHIIIDEPFSVKKCFDLIEKYHITIILTSPSQLSLLAQSQDIERSNLSSIRFYFCGGSALHPQFFKKMQDHLKNGYVIYGYGMSESCSFGTARVLNSSKTGSSGLVLANTEMKIINHDDGIVLDVGEIGEILIRTPYNWAGYYGDPVATRQILDNDRWIHSGDLGYFDKDGYLFVVDRINDILKYKSYQFSPTEIESIILEIPDVVEVSVCGIPDLIYTNLPAAAIVKRTASKLSEKEVYDYVANKMSDNKKLRGGVYFLDSLPKTPSAKIQRNKVKDILMKISKNFIKSHL